MQLWFERNRHFLPRNRPLYPFRAQVLPLIRSQNRGNYFVRPAANVTRESENEPTETAEEAEEPDLEEDDEVEENNEEEPEEETEEQEEEAEEQEEEVEQEATGGDEDLEYVLEYTPVTSAMELPSITMTEDKKRKASFVLENDNSKKRCLTLVECPICQETLPDLIRTGKVLMAPSCGHVLCSNCAMRIWIQRRKRCPKCNNQFNIQKLIPVYL
ncbi:E3 ubiquitin-protein ligase RNF4 like protein [Argiope bruennichi]|uniref:E3 ubiquitin-protein ligase RNF4 like protein n=1 Tax=Argiope bruennichi TaxID=94029 RepID=A0A8T0F743_ARGBR|nr:E3 ubiquitin-protein ligase RNF4 like protein [Argiope bruennichi]